MLNFGCWNINGFTPEKLINETFYKHFDIFGIVETWTGENVNITLPNYIPIHCPGTKSGKRGRRSGGIIIFIRKDLYENKFVQKVKMKKNLIWIKLAGDAFNQERDTYLCTVYIPPISPNNDSESVFDELRADLTVFSSVGNIILMGDFNSRTSELEDYIRYDSYSDMEADLLPDSYINDYAQPQRNNCDLIINENGRTLIDICIESQLRILNGKMLGDSLGYYTYYGPRGCSAIDYFIVSNDIFDKFIYVNVLPPTELSDHCVIKSAMQVNHKPTLKTQTNTQYKSLPGKYYTNECSKHQYATSLVDEQSTILLSNFMNEIEDENIHVEKLTENLTTII